MSNQFNFGQPPDLAAMKQDIADRQFHIKIKGMLISGVFIAAGLATMFLFPAALGGFAPLVGLMSVAGGAIAGLATMKEAKKLQIDEEFLQSRMEGKNWWGGYREEVGGQEAILPPDLMGGSTPSRASSRHR